MIAKRVNQQRRYLSYLLRLWQEGGGVPEQWRASLESPMSGELQGFASLEELFAFLEKKTRSRTRGLEDSDEAGSGQPATLE